MRAVYLYAFFSLFYDHCVYMTPLRWIRARSELKSYDEGRGASLSHKLFLETDYFSSHYHNSHHI